MVTFKPEPDSGTCQPFLAIQVFSQRNGLVLRAVILGVVALPQAAFTVRLVFEPTVKKEKMKRRSVKYYFQL